MSRQAQLGGVGARGWQYYRFELRGALRKAVLSLTLLSGGADLFVRAGDAKAEGDDKDGGGGALRAKDFRWSSLSGLGQIVLEPQATEGYEPDSGYTVGVHGVTAASFYLLLTLEDGVTVLQDSTASRKSHP